MTFIAEQVQQLRIGLSQLLQDRVLIGYDTAKQLEVRIRNRVHIGDSIP
jgi:hypothetical protein